MAKTGRQQWGSETESLVVALLYTVGFANISRFTYLAWANGGIMTFSIPYIIMMILFGIPLLYLEIAIGQCVGFGPLKAITNISPLFRGIGISMVIVTFICSSYYLIFVAWAIYYLCASMQTVLPWTYCPTNATSCQNFTLFQGGNDVKTFENTESNFNFTIGIGEWFSPSEHYYLHTVLKIPDVKNSMGSMNWELCGCLALAWLLCFLYMFIGVKVIGKISYVTLMLQCGILIVLIIRVASLPGSYLGILYLFVPNYSLLKRADVWFAAAGQVFLTLGLGLGTVITYSSYNPKSNNIFAATVFLSHLNWLASVLCSFVIFAASGYIAEQTGVPFKDVVGSGSDMIFVTFSMILGTLPVPQAWSILFYFSFILVGLSTQIIQVQFLVTTFKDWLNDHPSYGYLKLWSVAIVCGTCFLLGLPNAMEGGRNYMMYFDSYAVHIPAMVIVAFEIIAVCYVFGIQKIRLMTQKVAKQTPPYYFIFCWKYIAFILVVCLWVKNIALIAGEVSIFPLWSIILGWLLMLTVTSCIPILIYYDLISRQLKDIRTNFKDILKQSISPRLGYLQGEAQAGQINPPNLSPQGGEVEMNALKKREIASESVPLVEKPQSSNINVEPPQYTDVADPNNPDNITA